MNAVVVAVDESLVNLNCDGWMDKKPPMPHEPTHDDETVRILYPKELASRPPRDRRKPNECETTPRLEREKCSGASTLEGVPGLALLVFALVLLRL